MSWPNTRRAEQVLSHDTVFVTRWRVVRLFAFPDGGAPSGAPVSRFEIITICSWTRHGQLEHGLVQGGPALEPPARRAT